MSNSKLATSHYWTNNYSSRNGAKIVGIMIHHMAFNGDAKSCYNAWKTREGSAHYCISSAGKTGQTVDEKYRAWSCANAAADSKFVTIELANDKTAPTWHVSDKAIAACIELCVDICKRNNIKQLKFTGNKNGNLQMHKYYMATTCPGPYLESKFPYIASEVNKKLKVTPEPTPVVPSWNGKKVPFLVKVEVSDLYIRKGPGIKDYGRQTIVVNGKETQFCPVGTYTIIDVQENDGYIWGKLKSSEIENQPRWIALDYTKFVKEV